MSLKSHFMNYVCTVTFKNEVSLPKKSFNFDKIEIMPFLFKTICELYFARRFFVLDRQTLVARFSHAESVGNNNY